MQDIVHLRKETKYYFAIPKGRLKKYKIAN